MSLRWDEPCSIGCASDLRLLQLAPGLLPLTSFSCPPQLQSPFSESIPRLTWISWLISLIHFIVVQGFEDRMYNAEADSPKTRVLEKDGLFTSVFFRNILGPYNLSVWHDPCSWSQRCKFKSYVYKLLALWTSLCFSCFICSVGILGANLRDSAKKRKEYDETEMPNCLMETHSSTGTRIGKCINLRGRHGLSNSLSGGSPF